MAPPELRDRLVDFIQSILPADQDVRIDERTPLLELGILDSLKTAILLNFIHNELQVTVPPAKLTADNFKDVASIAQAIEEPALVPTDMAEEAV
jgi:acyl carrier protein